MTRVCSDEVEYIGWKLYGILVQLVPVGSNLTWPNPLAALAVMDPVCPLVRSLMTARNPFGVSRRDTFRLSPDFHEQVPGRIRRERGRGGVDGVRWSRRVAVLGDEREVDVLKAGPGRAGSVLTGPVDRVLGEAENVQRGAPLGRVTGACPDRDLPGRPRNPPRRVELQLRERRPRVIGRDRRVDDVAVAIRGAGRHLVRVGLRVAHGHAQPERTVQLELVGLTRRVRVGR